MHKIIFILSFIFLLVLNLRADLPDTVWTKHLGVTDLKFTKDGNYLACLVNGGIIQILESKTGNLYKQYQIANYQGIAPNIDFSPDGKYMNLGMDIIDWQTGEKKLSLNAIENKEEFDLNNMAALFFTGDGKYIVCSFYWHFDTTLFEGGTPTYYYKNKSIIFIFDSQTGQKIKTYSTNLYPWTFAQGATVDKYFTSLRISPDGKYMAIGYKEDYFNAGFQIGTIIINTETWDSSSTNKIAGITLFSNDNSKVYSGYSTYSFPDFKLLHVFNKPNSNMIGGGIILTPNEKYIVIQFIDQSNRNTLVYVLDNKTDSVLYIYNLHYMFKITGDAGSCLDATNDYIIAGGGGIDMLNIKTNPTDVKESPVDLQTTLSPNPATDNLNIKLNTNNYNSEIELYNIFGEKLLSQQVTNSNINLNISQYAPGVYFIKIQTQDGTKVQKFVKE